MASLSALRQVPQCSRFGCVLLSITGRGSDGCPRALHYSNKAATWHSHKPHPKKQVTSSSSPYSSPKEATAIRQLQKLAGGLQDLRAIPSAQDGKEEIFTKSSSSTSTSASGSSTSCSSSTSSSTTASDGAGENKFKNDISDKRYYISRAERKSRRLRLAKDTDGNKALNERNSASVGASSEGGAAAADRDRAATGSHAAAADRDEAATGSRVAAAAGSLESAADGREDTFNRPSVAAYSSKAASSKSAAGALSADSATAEDAAPATPSVSKSPLRDHIYQNIYPWTTKYELVDLLISSKIFENRHFLALNKPYGLGQVRPPTSSKTRRMYGCAPPVNITLQEVLPSIKEHLGLKFLEIEAIPEKWNSGVLLLSKNERATRLVHACMQRSNRYAANTRHCWVLAHHVPRPSNVAMMEAGTEKQFHKDGHKVPVIVLKPTKSRIRRGEVEPFRVHHKTLATSEQFGAALVEASVSRSKQQALRVWLTHCLAAPLGDHLVGGRVGTLMGQPVPVPHNRAANRPPLSFECLKQLMLSPQTEDLMPLMVHLRSVHLTDYLVLSKGEASIGPEIKLRQNGNENSTKLSALNNPRQQLHFDPAERDLVITAPLPEHFLWTMERLGIALPGQEEGKSSESQMVCGC